ncbi:methyltransferase domain-containing protein [Microbispora triticiradicis]|uniref:Protein-L-isoaspartate O-methyltransferase n=2 Tax=Microbispora TaxID=2005 RepID=A0ABY3M3V6_9ACTN|nr:MULTISPECIES: methyltransferase domain-containing protein [Microbispora]TLP62142.1 methyltransferase domain-containing protein [Microbispora fusca]TYB66250.1 methyltransferase domain-containing protein [Microbispora tritici]
MTWEQHAARLAADVTRPASRWRGPVATTPRQLFVPRWWEHRGGLWTLRDGPADEREWLKAAFSDVSLVTRVGSSHADHATGEDHPAGLPTSSSTLPGLAVRMYQHADIQDGVDVLDVGVGSGYGAALLTRRLGDRHVTSVDLDAYLTEAATERLDRIGLHPRVVTCDATGPLPGTFDRIAAMVSVRPVPASWLAALRPGGRLVTTIANTMIIIVADRTDDGGAFGRVQWDRAGFMTTRHGEDYPPGLSARFEEIRDQDGEDVGRGRYPMVEVIEAWELRSMLEVTAPGISHWFEAGDDGRRTAWMVHADGSWARAEGVRDEAPLVHQGGPRRLWDILDQIRHQWLVDGSLPLYGAWATISPDGAIRLERGRWQATIA